MPSSPVRAARGDIVGLSKMVFRRCGFFTAAKCRIVDAAFHRPAWPQNRTLVAGLLAFLLRQKAQPLARDHRARSKNFYGAVLLPSKSNGALLLAICWRATPYEAAGDPRRVATRRLRYLWRGDVDHLAGITGHGRAWCDSFGAAIGEVITTEPTDGKIRIVRVF